MAYRKPTPTIPNEPKQFFCHLSMAILKNLSWNGKQSYQRIPHESRSHLEKSSKRTRIYHSGGPTERLEKRNMIRKGQNGSGILMMLGMILAKLWMNTAVLVMLSGQNC